ncbi:M56 family metallopeptidase [Flavobacterium nackdongense]|uniref:M56 family peptidase n=1 Tax=Flavobacterium nackdongense TaxID=2547394 RepID=A0A4P6Y6J3_9FLAO|nr:M56 family metallopeptidase [Flavobacterium nackdongense]QBN18031.1 M56 family peptidase [Flavobacterium nackdongense]
METLFIYLVKSSGLIGMFYVSYYILLRKETFFNSNRWFLLAGLISSVVLPAVVFTKIVWVDPSPNTFDWSKIPVTNSIEEETFEINWYLISAVVYSIGILGFLLKFAFDFRSLSKVLKGKTIQRQADFKFIDVSENIAPFSYFNSIVYNSSLYSDTELENILEHEKVHSAQNHTIDVLISSFFCVIFWFNPLVWLYKKAIVQNLEFIADSEASKSISDKKAYQLTLLKITTQENCVVLTNHFYQSLIKKRIVMLNKNQSNKRNYWKYLFIIPLLGAFVFLFQIKVIAQKKESSKQEITNKEIPFYIVIDKNRSEKEIKESSSVAKSNYNVVLKFSKIKRNSNGEITAIKVTYTGKEGLSGATEIKGTKPIKSFAFFVDGDKMGFLELDNSKINGKVIVSKYPITDLTVNTATAVQSVKITDKDIYIDGVKATNAAFSELDPNAIDKVEVNTFENNVKITTKKINILADNFETKTISKEKPLIILNGIRTLSTLEDLNKLDPNLIQSMNVLKGQKAIDKYGKSGENGVLEIITKENTDGLEMSPSKAKKESELDKGEIENTGNETVFSKERWLEMYKTLLKARFSVERMKVKNEQAKVELEKAKQSLKSKLFS